MASEKDRERASEWAAWWLRQEWMNCIPIDPLAAEFAAVRAEERAAIVAWLLRRSDLGDGSGSLYGAASAIERGEHQGEQ